MKNKDIHSWISYLVRSLLVLILLGTPLAYAADPAPMSATELWKAYQSDSDAADKAHKGKTIVVTGSVYFAAANPISKTVYVSLKNDEGKDQSHADFRTQRKRLLAL